MITGTIKKEIPGFENYEISEKGVIYNLRRYIPAYDHIETIKPRIDRAGYYTVRLRRDGKTFTKYLHRLLGETFIPNPNNLPILNHKDGNKLNYQLQNLEFTTHSGNIKHAHQHSLIKKCNKQVIDIDTGTTYQSVKEAAIKNSINYTTLKNYLNGNRPNPTSLRYNSN